jgi:PAS domain S-box-containing protein
VRSDSEARPGPAATLEEPGKSAEARHNVTQVTRLKLLLLLPLTMAVLVAATGYFTMQMTERVYLNAMGQPQASGAVPLLSADPRATPAPQSRDWADSTRVSRGFTGLRVQVGLIAVIAAVLGFAMALGVTAPLRQVANRLEAMASGDLQGALDVKSTSEVDSVAGAFNDAIRAVNRYIFQSMTGAVITLDTKGIVIGSSPAAEVVLGYHEEELVGRRFSTIFAPTPESRQALLAMEQAIARRKPISMEDVVVAAKDGRPMRIGVNVSYLRPPAGSADATIIGVMIAFKDLTEIRRLRERLQQADQLVALGTLTAGVAHELRNPLASLQGLVELLGRDFAEDDPKRRYVKTMLDAIDRLNRLVEDLLLLSSPGAPTTDPVDLNSVARDMVMFARLGLGEKQIALTSIEGPAPVTVLGSQARLGQALTNIVLNAVQATPTGGSVTVTTSVAEQQAIWRIHNTGSHIAPEQMKKLFVPFFTTKSGGTGLGLAIARQIVTAHGGRIEVESDQGTGTTFVIDLPLAHAGAQAAVVPAEVTGEALPA